jgi:hypothetical protein
MPMSARAATIGFAAAHPAHRIRDGQRAEEFRESAASGCGDLTSPEPHGVGVPSDPLARLGLEDRRQRCLAALDCESFGGIGLGRGSPLADPSTATDRIRTRRPVNLTSARPARRWAGGEHRSGVRPNHTEIRIVEEPFRVLRQSGSQGDYANSGFGAVHVEGETPAVRATCENRCRIGRQREIFEALERCRGSAHNFVIGWPERSAGLKNGAYATLQRQEST